MLANETENYRVIAPSDEGKDKKEQTVFVLRNLTFAQDTWIEDRIDSGDKEGTVISHYLNMGLVSVENLKDKNGIVKLIRHQPTTEAEKANLQEYPGGVWPFTDESLSKIDKTTRLNLSLKIKFGKQIEEPLAKN